MPRFRTRSRSRRRRKLFKKRGRSRGSTRTIAVRALKKARMVQRTRPRPELKFTTLDQALGAIAPGVNRSTFLSDIPQGTSGFTRIGNVCKMRTMQLTYTLVSVAVEAELGDDPHGAFVTVILVAYPKSLVISPTAPLISNLYVDPNKPEISLWNTKSDPNWLHPFKVIYHRRFWLSDNLTSQVIPTGATNNYVIPPNYSTKGKILYHVNTKIKINRDIHFDRATATHITQNALFLYVINSDDSTVTVNCRDLKWRLWFTDS